MYHEQLKNLRKPLNPITVFCRLDWPMLVLEIL